MQLQATEVAATAEESGPAWNAAVGLTSWQHQQEEKKIMWNAAAG
jgi:hypothetical protein